MGRLIPSLRQENQIEATMQVLLLLSSMVPLLFPGVLA
jgi:hypothetical protein